MIKNIYKKASGATLSALAVSLAMTSSVFADAKSKILDGAGATGQTGGTTVESGITTITNILLFLIGAIAVIAIIIGGIRYVTSNGDASQTKSAKDTILYAVVGLIVAIVAYAIVQFVVSRFQ